MEASAVSPKERFTTLDTLATAREIRGLVPAHVDKAFDLAPSGHALVLRSAAAGRQELELVPGRYAARVARSERHADSLSPFARELRRLLTGARLTEVPDPAGERYLELRFHRPDAEGPITVGLELFGTGNLVVAREERLVAVLTVRRWAHRTVRIGAPYTRPPARVDPFRLDGPALAGLLAASRADLASTLATRAGLGGPLTEELLARTGLAGSAPAPHEAEERSRALVEAIQHLVDEVGDRPAGYLYRRGEELIDVAPVRLERWTAEAGVAVETVPAFSEAVVRYFGSLPAQTVVTVDPREVVRAERGRLAEQQRSAVDRLRSEAGALKADAEAILLHFGEAERRLAEAAGPDGRVRTELGERTVELLPGRPVRDSVNALYAEAKRIEAKLEGAQAALAATERSLAEIPAAPAPPTGDVADRPTPRGGRPRWFERYRWFVSSEGLVVIGGRDAASNDLIVRRYLKEGDRYVHADIHGAPSVIVKHAPPGGPEPTETTMREAGQWGVSFSKAWRAELASGRAFWVEPDQVSKAGASGEYVARGAWVIHGTKNVLDDLPLELAVGEVLLEGERRWTVAPPTALAARGEVRYLLRPGDERNRAEREIELSRALGLPRDRLQSLLPAGGLTVRRA